MAEFVLSLHLIFILYIILGFGMALYWNNTTFRLIHAGTLAFITTLMILGIPCPLTVWEERLRGDSYEGSFIGTWLNRIVYWEWYTPQTVFIIDLLFAVVVFSSFWWRPLQKRKH